MRILLVVVPLYALGIFTFAILRRRSPSFRSDIRQFAILLAMPAVLVTLLAALLPVRLFARMSVLVVFGLGGLLLLILLWAAMALFARKQVVGTFRAQLRAQQRAGYDLVHSDDPRPPRVEDGLVEMKQLGFQLLVSSRGTDGSWHLLLFRRSDSIVGEILEYVTGREVRTIYVTGREVRTIGLEFTSVLRDRRGILATGNMPTFDDFWVAELRQTFPGASAEQLLLAHQRAIKFLRPHGLDPESLTAREVLEARSWGLTTRTSAALAAPRAAVLRRMKRLVRKEPVAVGILSEQLDIEERLMAIGADSRATN
jgi:hypothetical protein